MKTLSIRQPWAWLIVNGHKDVENRTWPTRHRGPLFIHAGRTMTRDDYESCRIFVGRFSDLQLPDPADLERGGIVGQVDLVRCEPQYISPWFCGPWGFVLRHAQVLPFRPCKGQLMMWEEVYP